MRFDDERAVADAGIVLPVTLAARLGLEALVDRFVRLGERVAAANAGSKVMTLVSAMLLGADSIDDCDVLRSGRTATVVGHRVAAPSTLGTFLRAFTFGHVRQLDRVLGEALKRAWEAGAGPGAGRLVVDVDSFVATTTWAPTAPRVVELAWRAPSIVAARSSRTSCTPSDATGGACSAAPGRWPYRRRQGPAGSAASG